MHIHKPDDALLLLGYACQAGRPVLTATVGYVCAMDGARVSEREAWQWLMPLFPDEPFDLGEKKVGGGFGVAGEARAPADSRVDGLTVRAGVGLLEGCVLVQGDRRWTSTTAGWRATAAQPFKRMPIGLARAYGGSEWRNNPYGCGHSGDGADFDGVLLPNIELPDQPVLKPSDTPATATLGPQPLGSSARNHWLGTLDQAWVGNRLPWLPEDTDPRWYDRFVSGQCQSSYWRGDEPWFAESMHSQHSLLQGKLPGLRPRLLLRTVAEPDRHTELDLDLDTVWLMPNDERVIVLYRAQTGVRREDAKDVLGLAVFTETLTETPQPLAHWSQVWQDALEQERAMPVAAPVAMAPEALERLELARAETEQQARAFETSLQQEVDQEFKDAEAEAQGQLRAQGFDVEALKTQGAKAEVPDLSAQPDLPTEPQAYEAALQARVEEEFKQAESEARTLLEQQGFDVDALRARAAATSVPEPDGAAIAAALANVLPGSDSRRQGYIKEFTEFQKEMDGLDENLQTQFEQAEQDAATTAGAYAGHYAADDLPSGPRERLTRDMLLDRIQRGVSVAWTELYDLDLSGLNLASADLRQSILRGCDLRGAVLSEADLTEALLEKCKFGGAAMDRTRLVQAQIESCDLRAAQLTNADFSGARINQCIFDQAGLGSSCWDDTQVIESSFEAAQLKQACGQRTQFVQCCMACVDATESRFEKATFEQCTLDGAIFNKAWSSGSTLQACQAARAQFEGANLQGLRSLQDTRLDKANLNGADLQDASLQNTSLAQAVLREARLDRALIKECDLSNTDAWRMVARNADFTDSNISQASWRGANLMQAVLRQARLQDTDLSGANLHAAQTRTATVQGLQLEGALMTRCRLLQEYDRA